MPTLTPNNYKQDDAYTSPIQVTDDEVASAYPCGTYNIPIQRVLKSSTMQLNFYMHKPTTNSTTHYSAQGREPQQKSVERRKGDTQASGSEKYTMKESPHGLAVLIINNQFKSADSTSKMLPNRRGSQIDENNLQLLWEFLNYDVRTFKNLSASEITANLRKIACESHANYDSFVCCILSYAHLDGIYGTDGEPVKINDIADIFKESCCPLLAGKPKMFFIQANCVKNQKFEDVFGRALPKKPDYLFSYVTAPCNISYKGRLSGSWYVSILRDVFSQHAKEKDLLEMLSIVNQRVSEAYNTHSYQHCPPPVTQLLKQVWFFGNSDLY